MTDKKNDNKGSSLPIMEMFYSIQGEGYYSGRPAVFIRLGGCDVGCHWCDVKESWEAQDHPQKSIDEIVHFVKEQGANFVVITGGEPAMYDLTELTNELHKENIFIALETSGVYSIKGQFDWICFSPKKFKAPTDEVYHIANELKVIVFNRSDLSWAEGHRQKVAENCKLYLQPEWSKKEENTDLIIDYIKANHNWNISLQTHKYIGVE
ncbi:7-carboxy-7-deazaguanine synthase QueE [Parvicella tangerina]|uniref:7-carboxy-7-deazaguanine synthase n=1 Tax=Parvicella tangerina TaxID=2829795 RepID=A0A916JL17_9FLAO|nr:7-carboxy-7-deazaguanine synthase QueE [Parvicella tangerina]CAG5078645.1 7-carboxy-7-deazaguanine synthase [Parvicella tangerina]